MFVHSLSSAAVAVSFLPSAIFCVFCLAISVESVSESESSALDVDCVVNTSYGQIQGFPITIEGTQQIAKIFLGIPFARPPINERRFEKPVAPKKWSGIKNVTQLAPSCFPYHRKAMWVEEQHHSEDCLHMNIMAPGWKSPDGKQFPVLVYVHGGAFQFGTIRQVNEEVVARKYVKEGIVFVAFQYRTGTLGFAATGDEKFAGNYGLWDQVFALQFVHDNIAKFGGDPKRVTLLGFSAGAASVSALSVVPHSSGLFQQVIQMSGTLLTEWATSNRAIFETERLAKEVGCDATLADSAALKKCLKSKSVHELLDAVDRMGQFRHDLNTLMFTPRLDADFFPDDQIYLIEKAPPKRTMIGVSELESLTFTMLEGDPGSESPHYVPREKWANYSRKDFEQFVVELIAPEKAFGAEEAPKVQKRIVDFYLGEEDDGNNKEPAFFLRKYTEMLTDLVFLVPSQQEAIQKTALGWPIYLYMIDHFARHSFPEDVPVKGAYHCVELPALFDVRFVPFPIKENDEEDTRFEQLFLQAINNFVRTGDPSSPLLQWPSLNNKFPLQYALLNGNAKPEVRNALAPEKLEFWRNLRNQFSFDIIRGVHKITLRSKDEL